MTTTKAVKRDFDTELRARREIVNGTLGEILNCAGRVDENLIEPVRYVLEGGGKRLRPALVLWCCEIVSGGVNDDARIAAAAIEMVHTYSLVHDDLPAMDDDDLRRARVTCHKEFDEATAILTGDALLTLAFEILAKDISQPTIAVRLVGELAEAAGASGMIAGQMADLKAEGTAGSEQLLQRIHLNKTAKMFRCAAATGAITGGGSRQKYESLCDYGLKIGLGFQVADDILDVCGSSKELGKTAGKDEKADKLTYPKILGIEKSRQLENKLAQEAIESLKPFGVEADILRQLAMVLLERTK